MKFLSRFLAVAVAVLLPNFSAQAQTNFGHSLFFSGTNQFVVISNFGSIIPTNEVTVEFWALVPVARGQSAFMLNPDTDSDRFNAHINYGTNGQAGITYWDFGNLGSNGRVNANAAANSISNWVHYTLVSSQSSNSMAIYTNGVLQITRTNSSPFIRGAYDLQIGGNTGYYFRGFIDDFRVWSIARSASDIQANYYKPLTGSESNLLVYYKFDDATGTVASNSATATGAAFNGTLINGPVWTTATPTVPTTVVTTTNDSGAGSLRSVIAGAPAGLVITFATNLAGATIVLINGQININQGVVLDGSSLSAPVQISGNFQSRLFIVATNTITLMDSIALINGKNLGLDGTTNLSAGEGDAGALWNFGTLTLNNCVLNHNLCQGGVGASTGTGTQGGPAFGGTIANNGTLTLNNDIITNSGAFGGGTTSASDIGGNATGSAIYNSGVLVISNSTITGTHGAAGVGGSCQGGAVYNIGTLTMHRSTCANNFLQGGDASLTFNAPGGDAEGAGIYNDIDGTAVIDNSTIASNCVFGGTNSSMADGGNGYGAGVFIFGGTNKIVNCTISSNLCIGGLVVDSSHAGGSAAGGGIYNQSTLWLTNSIVAGNFPSQTDIVNVGIGRTAGSNNLIDVSNPQLAALGDYGGSTQTMPPLSGSPAIDAGLSFVANQFGLDQIGNPRQSGSAVDLGAVEVQQTSSTGTPGSSNSIVDSQITLTITAPADHSSATKTNITVSGTVKGLTGESTTIQVSVNTNTPVLASLGTSAGGRSSWTAAVSLTPGANIITAIARDTGDTNLTSPAVTRTVFFDTNTPSIHDKAALVLTVSPTDAGTVSGQRNGASLEVDHVYTLVAHPGNHWIFSNWTAGVSSTNILGTNVTLSFLMASNTAIQANFVTNPFPTIAGTYAGLFAPTSGTTEESSGFISLVVAPTGRGAYSAKLLLDGGTYAFSGVLGLSGNTSTTIARVGKQPVEAILHLNLGGTPDNLVTGYILNFATNGWTAAVTANRQIFSAHSNPATNFAGKYTTIIPPGTNAPVSTPGGYSYATLSVTTAGIVTISGSLADKTTFAQSTAISENGAIPLYVSLYAKKGSIQGWLTLTNSLGDPIGTNLFWFKPSVHGGLYPSGFALSNLTVSDSIYTNKSSLTNAVLTVSGGDLSTNLIFTNVSLSNNKITSSDALVTGTVASATGLVTLTIKPANGTKITARGVLLPTLTFPNAAGWFSGADQSGAFILHPPAP